MVAGFMNSSRDSCNPSDLSLQSSMLITEAVGNGTQAEFIIYYQLQTVVAKFCYCQNVRLYSSLLSHVLFHSVCVFTILTSVLHLLISCSWVASY